MPCIPKEVEDVLLGSGRHPSSDRFALSRRACWRFGAARSSSSRCGLRKKGRARPELHSGFRNDADEMNEGKAYNGVL